MIDKLEFIKIEDFWYLFHPSFLSLFLFKNVYFSLYHTAYGMLVPQPGIEPRPSAVRAQSPNHRTAREFPLFFLFLKNYNCRNVCDMCGIQQRNYMSFHSEKFCLFLLTLMWVKVRSCDSSFQGCGIFSTELRGKDEHWKWNSRGSQAHSG